MSGDPTNAGMHVHVAAFPYFDIIKIRFRQPRLNFAIHSSHMLPRRLRWLAVLLYRSTTIYTNFLTLRTLFRVWSEDRLCPGLPSHLTATIMEGVAGSVSLPSPLTRIPRVMLVEDGLFYVKGRATQVAGVNNGKAIKHYQPSQTNQRLPICEQI